MKNSEWGAVAYLSISDYGKNDEGWINNDRNYTTGCAANSVDENENDGCPNRYESTAGVKASTTGNIYGIYDLAGGAWERVAAYVDNGHSNLKGRGSSIISASAKYKDIYTKGNPDNQLNNYGLAINKKGDAVYETSNNIDGSYSWFNDYSYMPNADGPWFERGARSGSGSHAGAYSISDTTGVMNSRSGFRPVLVVNSGL